ncbi:unnamed protein product [Nesidiocoris tenuis]|uniref:Uncharacterized protein n=1 Tax=Nesidiocoris tenuis TaxID=355587 RepID=A0A6H5GCD6_9HEMI|nr:unnamed protein product [Nesidiocoris tenuis]
MILGAIDRSWSVEGRSRDRPEIKPCSRGRRKGEIFTGESYAPLQGPETHEVKEQGRGVAAVVVALTKASRHWRTGRCYLGAPYSDPADLRNRLEMNGHRVHEAGGTKCSTRKLCAVIRGYSISLPYSRSKTKILRPRTLKSVHFCGRKKIK